MDISNENTPNMVSLNVIKTEKQKQADDETFTLVQKTIEAIQDEVKASPDTSGLFAIVYDKDKNPKILWGGDMDYVKMIGSLDIAKMELMGILLSAHELTEID